MHDKAEINAVLEVLRGGPLALKIDEMESRFADLYRPAPEPRADTSIGQPSRPDGIIRAGWPPSSVRHFSPTRVAASLF
ncbi:hypothetical protein AB0L88_35610 [Saccharopolyspora shandongensis]|uniref:hypothetical protein n=1 Tax=Saccharopolyspora shandongensis TaxID=418495 RepID=UPI001C435558|nr:hypothetical protein [Saccharopolyspora shandongensis]